MTQLYEGMFLLDNQGVREDWAGAKSTVTDLLAKHGAEVKSARRWDERRLSYPIKGRRRGTYLLTYFEQGREGSATVRRDLDLQESVLRYLILDVDGIPEGELDHSQAELADDFSIPPPPEDDAPLPPSPEELAEQARAAEAGSGESASKEAKDEEPQVDEAMAEEAKADESKVEAGADAGDVGDAGDGKES